MVILTNLALGRERKYVHMKYNDFSNKEEE